MSSLLSIVSRSLRSPLFSGPRKMSMDVLTNVSENVCGDSVPRKIRKVEEEEPSDCPPQVIVEAKYEFAMRLRFGCNMNAEPLTIRFVKLNADAQTPIRGSAAAAGADLCSAEDCVVPAHGKFCVSTGLQVEVPYGYYGRVAPRSGLAAKNFIDVGAGVVDSDYRGELKVLLFNFGPTDFEVKKGDRVAQFICERIAHCNYVECESLTDTVRGDGGFGSTGK